VQRCVLRFTVIAIGNWPAFTVQSHVGCHASFAAFTVTRLPDIIFPKCPGQRNETNRRVHY